VRTDLRRIDVGPGSTEWSHCSGGYPKPGADAVSLWPQGPGTDQVSPWPGRSVLLPQMGIKRSPSPHLPERRRASWKSRRRSWHCPVDREHRRWSRPRRLRFHASRRLQVGQELPTPGGEHSPCRSRSPAPAGALDRRDELRELGVPTIHVSIGCPPFAVDADRVVTIQDPATAMDIVAADTIAALRIRRAHR
jgi:hypothetical protein